MGFIYRNYVLRSKSVHLADSNRWTMEVTIVRNKCSGEQTFSSEDTFQIKEVADMEGVIFARRIIDGEVKGLSIDDQKFECR